MPRHSLYIGALAAALLALAGAAEARMHAPYRGHRIVPTAAAPLDSFATPAAAYSMRKLRSAYTGPALRLRRASDNAEADINFLSFTGFTGAPIDTAAANAHCAATSCFIAKWYDQSGNARDLTNPAASQLDMVFNCIGTLPCSRTSGARHLVAAAQVTSATGIASFTAVAREDTAQTCRLIQAANQQLGTNSVSGQIRAIYNGAVLLTAPATVAVWHAANGVINGAASVVNVDGAETTGTVAPAPATENLFVNYGEGGANTCSLTEAVWWNGYALAAGERSALVSNQRSFWGF